LQAELGRLIARFTPKEKDPDATIEPLLVLSTPFLALDDTLIPALFRPHTGRWGMRDPHKVFVDDEHYNHGHGHAYQAYGVDPEVGAVVLVRPDQYVSKVVRLDAVAELERCLGGCLLEQQGREGEGKGVAKL
jgi:phenol 2-monooxygenase